MKCACELEIEKDFSTVIVTVIVTVTGFSPARFRFHNLIIIESSHPLRYLFIQEIISYLIAYSNACIPCSFRIVLLIALAIPFYLSVEPFLSEILGDVVLNNSYSNGFPTKKTTTTICKVKKKQEEYFVDIKM